MPEYTQFTGSDTRDLSKTQRTPRQQFCRDFNYFRTKGKAEWYLSMYRDLDTFKDLVAEADLLLAEEQAR